VSSQSKNVVCPYLFPGLSLFVPYLFPYLFPGPGGRTPLLLSPLERIERLVALLPPPRQHRHRYYGVLAPNAPLRAALSALAPEAVVAQPMATSGEEPTETPLRSPARYLWAMLLARSYEAFPLSCPTCGTEMRILAFITEASTVQRILNPIGEPATPPRIASYRPWHWVPASPAYTMPGRALPGRRVPRFASAFVIAAWMPQSRARDRHIAAPAEFRH
jgi:hypothetical protein